MNLSDTVLFSLCGVAVVGVVGWMIMLSLRLGAIERAVQSIATNTNALRELVELLRSLERNTSLLGGIRGVFGSKDHKKSS
jgi:hypothetical protein